MANQCVYCNRRRIPTTMLILGDNWIEFCEECGTEHTVTNMDTHEEISIKELYDRLIKEKNTAEFDPTI